MSRILKRLWAVLDARNKEFVRDRAAMGWNFLFPILVVLGFGYAFSSGNQNVFKVGTVGQFESPLRQVQYLEFVPFESADAALTRLRRHQVDLVLDGQNHYWINDSSPKGYLAERILRGSAPAGVTLQRQTVEGQEIRYVDWLISGLIGMNMMFSALFGVGYTIVRYRKNGVLKRLKATPLSALEFLVAQVISRLVLIMIVSTIVYFGTHALLHFRMVGSYLDLGIVMTMGAMCLIALGLLVAARISSEEFAGGLLNVLSWPMMFLSGVWFSLEGSHGWVKKVALAFPLTHVIDASRAIMTEGATLSQVSGNVVALGAMTVLFLVAGAVLFKWE